MTEITDHFHYEVEATWIMEGDRVVAIIDGVLLHLPEHTPIQLRGLPNNDARVVGSELNLDHLEGEHGGRAWMRVDVAVEESGANLTPHTVEELLGRRPPDAPPPSEG